MTMQSSWPDLPAAKDRRPLSFVAIDVNGQTVAQADTWLLAKKLVTLYPGCSLRPVYVDERDFRREDDRRKEVNNLNLYKPTPTRRLHQR